MDFYNDEEIEGIRKLLLDLEIKLNIFDQRKQHSCIFWYMLLIQAPTNVKLNSTAAKIIIGKIVSKKANPESRVYKCFPSLEKSGLIVKKYKDKHNVLTEFH